MQKRKTSTRQKFLKKRGLKKTPKGKEIDYKKPLADGGTDTQKNLRLIKKSAHKKKTITEAKKRAKKKK
ncbi:HNH endonuclease [Candidatus Parcubacteria bacterium]|nr:HNH endonuclease [Candidatus Parcubacteria bacterium]